MKILAIVNGEYGRRNVQNIQDHLPDHWKITTWEAPRILPPVIDYPEDYIPNSFPNADLILSFAEHRGVAELIPEIAGLCGAKAVIAAVDNDSWLPTGLARQLREWLERMNVDCVTPKPLCSLTEKEFGVARNKSVPYQSELIAEFAKVFGKPDIKITIDNEQRIVVAADVQRDTVCGCARHVAERLVGLPLEEVVEKAGLIHHHYPCLASMVKLPEFNKDTLMHESGNLMKDNLNSQVKPHLIHLYITPDGRSE